MVTNTGRVAAVTTAAPAIRATIPGVEHHLEEVAGRPLHWVTAGTCGSPVLLVHGFPETWWVFHRLVPLLARGHRVVAVDLPGFGESGSEPGDYSSAAAAETLHALVGRLELGPVHLSGQDIAGSTVLRLATQHPDEVRSLTVIEALVAGFGFERLAEVAHGGAWHIGAIATPGVAEFVFSGRMHRFLDQLWFPYLTRVEGAVSAADVDEFVRSYSRPGAWNGAQGLYSSALREGDELTGLTSSGGLRVPVLAVDGMGASTTAVGMRAITDQVTAVLLNGVGHHVALEAPERLAEVMLRFIGEVDGQG